MLQLQQKAGIRPFSSCSKAPAVGRHVAKASGCPAKAALQQEAHPAGTLLHISSLEIWPANAHARQLTAPWYACRTDTWQEGSPGPGCSSSICR